MKALQYVTFFDSIGWTDIPSFGGKNASLGELHRVFIPLGMNIPFGFAVGTPSFWAFLKENGLQAHITSELKSLDRENFSNLQQIGSSIRSAMHRAVFSEELKRQVLDAYRKLASENEPAFSVAVRSSATAEDLPNASFAGQHDSYLNICSEKGLIKAIHDCFVSLYNDRAIKYREDHGIDHLQVGMSVGVQVMVRADKACSGVAFTLEPESGFRNVIHIAGCWGLGENIVQGQVNPDEFYVFKTTFLQKKNAIIQRKLGSKLKTMVYAEHDRATLDKQVINTNTSIDKQRSFVLSDAEINQLSAWCMLIEQHYGKPMDIEWAKDGVDQKLYILQARPETTHPSDPPLSFSSYRLLQKGMKLVEGDAVGSKISSGIARIIKDPSEADRLKPGEIIVTELTNPDWDPYLKKAAGIVTDKGGRTSHASIVARELGIPAIVGTNEATRKIRDGDLITISCSEGKTGNVYAGFLPWAIDTVEIEEAGDTTVKPLLIVADPDQAFKLALYPSHGVGLMRLEFVISNTLRIHPMALAHFDTLKDAHAKAQIEELTANYRDKKAYFVDQLASAVAVIAAAFYPREVIVRMSDFKTNEYAGLIGGAEFESAEENPMIGFRGASRYDHDKYRDGFKLECEAMKKVREEMGLSNVKLMIPFCRTLEEAKQVLALMASLGLKRGADELAIYMMVEVPSNALLAEGFAKLFDGFSIGSNDLTQLTLGIDRDAVLVSRLFSERNPAVKQLISLAIRAAKHNGIPIGLCGQAPSDDADFAAFLVHEGIDSISFNPDAFLQGVRNIQQTERVQEAQLSLSLV